MSSERTLTKRRKAKVSFSVFYLYSLRPFIFLVSRSKYTKIFLKLTRAVWF